MSAIGRVSPYTVASYRDTFRLLLCFAEQRLRKAPSALRLADLDAPLVGAFLPLDTCTTSRTNVATLRGAATFGSPPFGYHQAVQRTSWIHFTLDGIPDVASTVEAGKAGFFLGNYTHAELHYLSLKPEFLAKTTLYRNLEPVDPPFTSR